jgi:hypothetical protein
MMNTLHFFIVFFQSFTLETQIFLVTICLFTLVFHLTYTRSTAEQAPAFLTTLGILGTFVGIAIGLKDFDTARIEASVPILIEGIKTAVWASACGILCALTIKLRDIEGFIKRKDRGIKKGASVDELIAALNAVEKALLANKPNTPPSRQGSLQEPIVSLSMSMPAEFDQKSKTQF